MQRLSLLALIQCCLITGCNQQPRTLGTYEKFQGKVFSFIDENENGIWDADDLDPEPVPNVTVILQPTEDGYEMEFQADANGEFIGEGIPGKYIYYFRRRRGGGAKPLPAGYLEPNMEHLVEILPNAEIECVFPRQP